MDRVIGTVAPHPQFMVQMEAVSLVLSWDHSKHTVVDRAHGEKLYADSISQPKLPNEETL